MNNGARLSNSMRNVIVGISSQVINLLLSFVSRTIFIKILGITYLGLNGLFTNVLSVLSLAELGIGNAIIFSMYKPLAENDRKKINALMNLYSKAYFIIGIIVAIIGIAIMPFLGYITNGINDIQNIYIIYILYLLNSVISYFFAYKRSIIIADQKNYIITKYQYIFNIMQVIFQVLILIITHNFILYLFIQILCSFFYNLFISMKAEKLYPFLKEKNKHRLDEVNKQAIFNNIKALMIYKVAGVALNGTDNIIMSKIVGTIWVGICSNYNLIIGAVTTILSQLFVGITASIGNLNVTENKEKKEQIFNNINFISFWIFGFCSISFWILSSPFIEIWIGKEYVLNNQILFVLILNFYISGMHTVIYTFRDAMGLFRETKYIPVILTIINIILSILLGVKFGILGIFLATAISRLCTSVAMEPYILYKFAFEKKCYRYYLRYIKYLITILFAAIVTNLISSYINENNIMVLLYKGFICLIIPNLIFLFIYRNTSEFKYFKNIFINILKKYNILKLFVIKRGK